MVRLTIPGETSFIDFPTAVSIARTLGTFDSGSPWVALHDAQGKCVATVSSHGVILEVGD